MAGLRFLGLTYCGYWKAPTPPTSRTSPSVFYDDYSGANTYPVEFYQQLPKFDFSRLENLDLYGLAIDEDVLTYMKQLRFPNLKWLNFHQNLFTYESAVQFFTREIMPELEGVDISNIILMQT